jgi:hypothetical protein
VKKARRAAARGLLVIAGLVSAGDGAARADVCSGRQSVGAGPLPGGILPADFGAIPEACGGTDLALRLRGSLLVASGNPDFYGSVIGTATIRLRYRIGSASWTWLTVAADLTTYRYVVNGPVSSQDVTFGPPTLGLHRALGAWPSGAATVYVRALLPLDTARENGVQTGLEVGLTGRRLVGTRGRAGVQGGLALTAPLDVVGGQSHGRLQPVALAEAWFAPGPRTALFAGLSARAEVSPDPTFITLAPRVAVRDALRHGLSLAILAEVPVAGEDRTDLIVAFTLAWTAQE